MTHPLERRDALLRCLCLAGKAGALGNRLRQHVHTLFIRTH